MDYADFVHLARTSEQACEEDSRAYRRSVIWFAALGYLWVICFVLLALGLLVLSLMKVFGGRFGFMWITLAFTAAGLLWVSLRALRLNFDAPTGVRLTEEDSPQLFQSLERIRRRIKGPKIHEVYLNDEFNASVGQVPRWGVLGGSVNRLVIGLPMLMALDKRRMLAVLAHEYGHLRGDHGRLGSWIYRTRESWRRLDESMEDSASPFAVATHAFLRWYSPRFVARTFAMARQEEYEADRVAAKLLGRDEIVAALVETEVKSVWLDMLFWDQHWAQAARESAPVGPFGSMQRLMAKEPDQDFAKATLRRVLQNLSSVDDTHPVLRDRVEALGGKRPKLPAQWSTRGSLSLLGAAGVRWLDYFDRQWCKDNADAWKVHHARLQRARARVLELQSGGANRSVNEQVETALLIKQLNPASGMSIELFKQALERDPLHPQALIGMAQSVAESDPERFLQYLERLWNHHPTHRLWAARMAVQELETNREGREYQEQGLKLWRDHRREAEQAEAEVMQELHRSAPLESVQRHDLSAFEMAEVRAELQRILPVREAWLVGKKLRSMPGRRAYVLLASITRAEDSARHQLCEELSQRIDLQGMLLVIPMEEGATREQLAQLAGEPIFVRAK